MAKYRCYEVRQRVERQIKLSCVTVSTSTKLTSAIFKVCLQRILLNESSSKSNLTPNSNKTTGSQFCEIIVIIFFKLNFPPLHVLILLSLRSVIKFKVTMALNFSIIKRPFLSFFLFFTKAKHFHRDSYIGGLP